MRVPSLSRRARDGAIAAVISAAAAACLAAPALAATSTISAVPDTTTPEQAVPVDLTFSGTNGTAAAADVEAVVRPAGGLACQSNYQEDVSTLGSEDTPILTPGAQNAPVGAYSVNASFKPPAPGSYQVCAWLDGSSNGSDPLAAPATAAVTARGPQVSQLTVAVPKVLTPGVPFQIGYTTQTDQQLNLLSVIAKAGTAPCGPSFESQGPLVTTVFGPGQQEVFGGPTTTTATAKEAQGSYVICTWIEGPTSGEVDGTPATNPITVGTPPPTPALKLTKVSASRRHGVSVAGTTTSKFTGKLVVVAACGRLTRKGSANAKRGKFSDHLAVPARCGRSVKQLKVTVSWAGSSAYAKQSVAKPVAIKS